MDGERLESAGFDAVVGNPPWVITSNTELREYLWEQYEYQSGQPDLYRFFVERCLSLTAGRFGMITPSSWFRIPAATKLRENILENHGLASISLVPQTAFEGVDANMATFIISATIPMDEIVIYNLDESGIANQLSKMLSENVNHNDYRIPLQLGGQNERLIVSKMREQSIQLGEIADTTVGYQLYHTNIHTENQIENEVFHSNTKLSKSYVPEIRSTSIEQYYVNPKPVSYVDISADFFRIPPERFRNGDRILIREVTGSSGIICANVVDELLFPKSVISLAVNDSKYPTSYLTALLNSSLLSFEFLVTGEKATQELFPRLSGSSLKRLSTYKTAQDYHTDDLSLDSINGLDSQHLLREIVDRHEDAQTLVADLADELTQLKSDHHRLNLDLLDYLGTYADGPRLGDMSYQPASGVHESVLAKTGSETAFETLRVTGARIERDGGRLRVLAIPYVKPTDESEYETNGRGYATLEAVPAMEFFDLSEAEANLIEAFVPHAVAEAGGFAGYRDNATATISPLDRLEGLALPKLSDVEGGVGRYMDARERAADLDEKIERTDELIDEIVYELYGLTDEEIAIVEEAVGE